VPAAKPAGLTLTEICADLVRLPLEGEMLSHAALSVPLQLTEWLLLLSTFTVWLVGLVLPCTAWKLNVVGVACSAHASGSRHRLTPRSTAVDKNASRRLQAGHWRDRFSSFMRASEV